MADNTFSEKNGGKWALSGFLYQAVVLGGYIAYSHNAAHHDLNDSDLSVLVETNGIIPELFDQDGVTLSPLAPDQCVFYQVKFSGAASTQTLNPDEFKDIISSFIRGARSAKKENKKVYKYVLVTNKHINTDVNEWIKALSLPDEIKKSIASSVQQSTQTKVDGQKQEYIKTEIDNVMGSFHSPVIIWTYQSSIDKIRNYGKCFGLNITQIDNGIDTLVGKQVVKSGLGKAEQINSAVLNCVLTGIENPGQLTLQAIQSHDPDVSSIVLQPIIDSSILRKDISAGLDRRIASNQSLIALVGVGGMGKSTTLANWVIHTLNKKPEAMIAIEHARNITDKWISSVVRSWSNNIPAFLNDDDNGSISRLLLANEGKRFKLYLIVDGLDEIGGDRTAEGNIQRLLNYFRAQKGNLIAKSTVLIVTCRHNNCLSMLQDKDLSELTIDVGPFTNEELSELYSEIKSSSIKEQIRASIEQGQPFLTVENDRNALLTGFSSIGSSESSVIEEKIFESLHHPVIWSCFARMDEREMKSLLLKGQVGLAALGKFLLDWFCNKLQHRLGQYKPHNRVIEKALSCSAVATNTVSIFEDSIWIDAFNKLGMSQNDVYKFLDEAESAGFITSAGKNRWKWSHQVICDSFAALEAETGVEIV